MHIPEWDESPDDIGDYDIGAKRWDKACDKWTVICGAASLASPAIGCILSQARAEWKGDRLELMFGPDVYGALDLERVSAFVSETHTSYFESDIEVSITKATKKDLEASEKAAYVKADVYADTKIKLRKELVNHPVVQEAIGLFDPEEIDVVVGVNPDTIRSA